MEHLNGNAHSLDHEVIFGNSDIHERIIKEITKAQNYVHVAMAWFTDPEILGALETVARSGKKVELIISENSVNEKLDFSGLKHLGATVLRVKKTGFGTMHQKFCVIDGDVVISGSYNWTINAKKNNDENIFIATNKNVVLQFEDEFKKLKSRGEEVKASNKSFKSLLKGIFSNKQTNLKIDAVAEPEEETKPIVATPQKNEYELVLDQMIAAEVSNFDRTILSDEGYKRCKANNGDHQVLGGALDSVYSVFINDINVVEDKKVRLKTKIKEEEVKSIDAEKERAELNLNTLEVEIANFGQNLTSRITSAKTQVETLVNDKKEIKEVQIVGYEAKIEELKEKVKALQIEFVKPAIKWFNAIPYGIFLMGIIGYLFIFYSSAAYILIFGESDFQEARAQGAMVSPPEIFNSEAIYLSLQRGWVDISFILLFVFVPLGLAIFDRLVDINKYVASIISFVFGVLIVDAAIAYKVAQTIHNINYDLGRVDEIWTYQHVFSDTNFYLVFVFGALGLIIFKFFYSKFIEIFESRDSDLDREKKKALAEQKEQEIDQLKDKIQECQEELIFKDNEILGVKNEIQVLTSNLEFLPTKKANKIEQIKNELNLKIQNIERITTVYTSHIDNDILPISIDSINDRINVYLEGWSAYLHDQYNTNIATEKAQRAYEEARKWKSERMEKRLIDTRIIKS